MSLNGRWIVISISFSLFALYLCIRPSVLSDAVTQFRGHVFDSLSKERRYSAAPIWLVNNQYFGTEFSLGTPPQSFRALVKHAPEDLAIPTISCEAEFCNSYQKYNSNKSSTARTIEGSISIEHDLPRLQGGKLSDIFRIGGASIPNQQFVTDNRQVRAGLEPTYDFDAIFSLSPPSHPAPSGLETPFMSMIKQHMLDGNRVSIKPPCGKTNQPGELTFGSTADHERLRNRLVRIPMVGTDFHGISAPWQVEVRAVHTAGSSTVLTNHTARFEAAWPFVVLPHHTVAPLFRALKPIDYLGYTLSAVDCDRRESLPDLTLNLNGHNFTLTAYQYTYERLLGDDSLRCLLAVDYSNSDRIILGTSFLKWFYSVFDWDNREIGLIPIDQFNNE